MALYAVWEKKTLINKKRENKDSRARTTSRKNVKNGGCTVMAAWQQVFYIA